MEKKALCAKSRKLPLFNLMEHRKKSSNPGWRGIAGQLLDMVVKNTKPKGITLVYLITDHTGFYERYGWEFLCMVQGDNEPDRIRMYIHR